MTIPQDLKLPVVSAEALESHLRAPWPFEVRSFQFLGQALLARILQMKDSELLGYANALFLGRTWAPCLPYALQLLKSIHARAREINDAEVLAIIESIKLDLGPKTRVKLETLLNE